MNAGRDSISHLFAGKEALGTAVAVGVDGTQIGMTGIWEWGAAAPAAPVPIGLEEK
jgi:hypothetical protein